MVNQPTVQRGEKSATPNQDALRAMYADGNIQGAYDIAKEQGWTPEQIDAGMGWDTGSTASYLSDQGYAPLGGQQPTTQAPLPVMGDSPGFSGGPVIGGSTSGNFSSGPVVGQSSGGGFSAGPFVGQSSGGGGMTSPVGTSPIGTSPVGNAPAVGVMPNGSPTPWSYGPPNPQAGSLNPHGGITPPGGFTGATAGSNVVNYAANNLGYQGAANPANLLDPNDMRQWSADTGQHTGYNARQAQVTPDMLVQNQLASAMDSPAAQRAKEQALEIMNARGMMNSDAAIEAANRAMISEALPIAQADAATEFQTGLANQSAENIARSFGAQAKDTMTLANMQALNTASKDFADSFNTAALQAPTLAQSNARLGLATDQQSLDYGLAVDAQRMAQAQQSFDQWKETLDVELRQAETQRARDSIQVSAMTNLIQSGLSSGVFGGQVAYGPDGTPYVADSDQSAINGFFDMIYDNFPSFQANYATGAALSNSAANLVV